MSEKKLAGKVAVITGGARGIGRGYALRLAQLGSNIAVIDRNLKSYEVYEFSRQQMTAATVMEECQALGVRAIGLQVDLADRAATEKAMGEIASELGTIDIAVCNAGGGVVKFADEITPGSAEAQRKGETGAVDVNTTGTPSDCPQEMLTRVINNNLMSCIYTCMAVAPYMKKQKSGKIITVSSTGGIIASGSYFPYSTAKAAIIFYTRCLAQELRPYNINVNCIAPGGVQTGRVRTVESADLSGLQRTGVIEDCVGVLEFLATDLSNYLTGEVLLVDGGAGRSPAH